MTMCVYLPTSIYSTELVFCILEIVLVVHVSDRYSRNKNEEKEKEERP